MCGTCKFYGHRTESSGKIGVVAGEGVEQNGREAEICEQECKHVRGCLCRFGGNIENSFVLMEGFKEAKMRAGNAAKLIVDALLQRFIPLARRRIDTAQTQVFSRAFVLVFPLYQTYSCAGAFIITGGQILPLLEVCYLRHCIQ